MSEVYEPPFRITDEIMNTVIEIGELVGRLSVDPKLSLTPKLRKETRIRSIYSSLAIEQNTLTLQQVTDIIDGNTVFGSGKTRVRVYHDGEGAAGNKALCYGEHLLRSEAAVDAYRIGFKTFEHGDSSFDAASCKEFSRFIVDHRYYDRKIAYFVCRNDSGFCLVRITHRLDNDQISACFISCFYYLCENINSVIESKLSHRFQEFAGWSDIDRNIGIIIPACLVARFLTDLYCGFYDLRNIIEFESVCSESVGVYDIRTCIEISLVKRSDIARSCEVPCLRKFAAF